MIDLIVNNNYNAIFIIINYIIKKYYILYIINKSINIIKTIFKLSPYNI